MCIDSPRSHALVIGGTHGLGLELARQCLRHDVDPVIVGRPKSTETGRVIDGRGVAVAHASIEDDASVQAMVDRLAPNSQPLDFDLLFYCPGKRLKGAYRNHDNATVQESFGVNLFGCMNVVRHFHRRRQRSYHLIVIASTTSWRTRDDEAVYGAAKAALAQFARNFHNELIRDQPKSKTLIVHPGGMRTPFWDGSGVDTSKFLDPAVVAEIIWDEINAQSLGKQNALTELHVLRCSDGNPVVERGAKTPQ